MNGRQLSILSGPKGLCFLMGWPFVYAASWLKTEDGIFVFVFLAELLMRIGIERKNFMYDAANWFDSVLVVAGLVDMFIILPLSKGEDQQSIVMLRTLPLLSRFHPGPHATTKTPSQ